MIQIFLIKLILKFAEKTPEPILMKFGRVLGLFWFYIVRYRRNLVLDNLRKAFKDEKSEKELLEIAKNNFIHYGEGFMEFLKFPSLTNEQIRERTVVKGKEYIDEAFKKGKGLIFLSGHFGNWDMLGVAQAVLGVNAYIITREAKNKVVNSYWMKIREDKGVRFLADRHSIFAIREKLKQNLAVGMIFDQHMPGSLGVKVNFFGRPAATMKAAALLAMKLDTTILPVNNYRLNGKNYIEILPAVGFEMKETEDEAILHNTQKYNDILEKFIRQHPEQWLWIHRRWK